MKSFWLVSLIFLSGLQVYGQANALPPDESKRSTINAVREKFDPRRNPAEDLKVAVLTAQKDGKRIILDVGGEWCVWCHILDDYLSANPDLAKIRDDNYVWLKINMSEENENKAFLSHFPQIPGYPHLFVLETDGELLHSQDTSPLESKKSYNNARFMAFLLKWVPDKKNAIR